MHDFVFATCRNLLAFFLIRTWSAYYGVISTEKGHFHVIRKIRRSNAKAQHVISLQARSCKELEYPTISYEGREHLRESVGIRNLKALRKSIIRQIYRRFTLLEKPRRLKN